MPVSVSVGNDRSHRTPILLVVTDTTRRCCQCISYLGYFSLLLARETPKGMSRAALPVGFSGATRVRGTVPGVKTHARSHGHGFLRAQWSGRGMEVAGS